MRTFILLTFYLISIRALAQDSTVVYFSFNSSSIDKKTAIVLSDLKQRAVKVTGVYGYTDTKGTNEYNNSLASKRVNAVCAVLKLKNPISKDKAAVGELFDFSTDDDKNRKVIIVTENRPSDVKKLDEQIKNAKKGDKIVLSALNFEPGLSILLKESEPTLKTLLLQMQNNKNLAIKIQGHICCQKEDENDLSSERARQVFNYLVANGISKSRMSFEGFGGKEPLYSIPEKNTVEEVANRRVEIKIISN